jgi:Transglutaminase-like superfamily
MSNPRAEPLQGRHQSPAVALSLPARIRLASEILASFLWVRNALRRATVAEVAQEICASPVHTSARTVDAQDRASLEQARRLGRAVTRTLAFAPGDTRCLIRSLVLCRLLSRRGTAGRLVIGVRPAPEFLGHAWVEVAGHPVLPPGDGSFGRLVEL